VSLITESVKTHRTAGFTRYAWGVLTWNLLVILWGAYVRASGSGAGCGSHWPLCNGEVVPHSAPVQTIIEFTHRAMSGVALVAMVGLAWWTVVRFPKDHRVRKAMVYSLIFFAAEALLGAGLVLLELVGNNASVGRAFYLALHLVNTQFLLAALTLTAWLSRDDAPASARLAAIVAAALPLTILVSITGVIAALGDTLFPAGSLAEGLRQDLSSGSSFLVRLRTWHPVLAVIAAGYCAIIAVKIMRRKPGTLLTNIALAVFTLSFAQLCAGAINLALLAPVAMQIIHLLLADLLWMALVLLTVESSSILRPGASYSYEAKAPI
jgi:cytochrome c oxidase assembly protein subunit 15